MMIRSEQKRAALAAAALMAVLGIAGCSSSSSSGSASGASTSASASTAPAPGSTSTSTTTVATTTGAAPTTTGAATGAATANTSGVPGCKTSNLRLTLASSGGAAGTAFIYYALTNAGAAACAMVGYPGVAVLDGHGQIVQHPAKRGAVTAVPVRLIVLRPEQRARFLVNSTDVIPSPGCPRPFTGTTLQVYPPNQRTAILVPRTGTFCNLRVGPVQRDG